MRVFVAVIALALLACSPESPMEPPAEQIMENIPVPVVHMIIMDGDTIYDANQ